MIATLLSIAALAAGAGPEFVEPADLIKRADLAGREVVVDDRVRYFLESKRGQGYDQLLLKRTDVLFRIPSRLKFSRPPSEPNARILGTPKVEEGLLYFDVQAIEMLPADSVRLDRELAKLRPEDYAGKRAWAHWAEKRGEDLRDAKLREKGEALEAEAFWQEASRPDADPIALAEKSAHRPIPEAMRDALIHRGVRDKLAKATTPADFDALARHLEMALPGSLDPNDATGADEPVLDAYKRDPATTYRDASEAARDALDRRLMADILQSSLEKQVDANPGEAAKLAATASEKLPDRPEVADRLRRLGLDEAEARVSTMRQFEVEGLAKAFRDQGQDDRARRLIQNWLADRRKNRLSASDAEGRVLLAASYEKLLGDRATAAALLREAIEIEPDSKAAIDALLSIGYRKNDAGWYDAQAGKVEVAANANPDPNRKNRPDDERDTLIGLTRAQVRSRLGGKPDVVVRSATQGRCVEQWIYKSGKVVQVVRFVYEPSTTEPRASAYYSDRK